MKFHAVVVLACLGIGAGVAFGQTRRFEAETGTLTGIVTSKSVGGYSGTGYVTQFDAGTDKLTLNVNVPAGLYELWVGYRSPYGKKGYGLTVGGETGSGMFNTSNPFAVDRAGLFDLPGGATTLSVQTGWGYYDVDYLELRPIDSPRPVAPVSSALADPHATYNTRALMNYLTSVYGTKTLAGQQGAITNSYLAKSGGLKPAVSGSDFMDYSPSRVAHGTNPNGETERMIAWAKQTGGVATMMWHWNAPAGLIDQPGKEWWRGFYTDATTFNVATALAQPGSANYNLLLRDIDAIAVQLEKFRDANVPVLWRPLHEAQGGWFWWGAQGPSAFKQLWHLMYDRLTNYHGLHNLIWEFTSSAAEENHLAWLPPSNEVDVIGIDVYTDRTSSMSGEWLDLLDYYDGKKMIALSETGTLPNANLMRSRGTRWSYFSPWSLSDVVNNYTSAELRALLGDADVITLDELPPLPWNVNYQLPGDADHDGDVDAADAARLVNGYNSNGVLTGYANGDFNGDGRISPDDFAIFAQSYATYGAPASGTEVPEGGVTWATLVGATFGCVRRGRGQVVGVR